MLLSCPKWGRLNFAHSAAGSSALHHTYLTQATDQATDYIKDEYRSAARWQVGTTSGNFVSHWQATRSSVVHVQYSLNIPSTADEVPANVPTHSVRLHYHDPRSFIAPEVLRYIWHIFWYLAKCFLLELLMAEGVITRYGVGGPDANDRKRAREDYSPGPSTKRRTGSTVKKEEMSANGRAQRIQILQVSRVNYSVLQRCRA
jgi:hypothetical protein